jgi:hypothetical protein
LALCFCACARAFLRVAFRLQPRGRLAQGLVFRGRASPGRFFGLPICFDACFSRSAGALFGFSRPVCENQRVELRCLALARRFVCLLVRFHARFRRRFRKAICFQTCYGISLEIRFRVLPGACGLQGLLLGGRARFRRETRFALRACVRLSLLLCRVEGRCAGLRLSERFLFGSLAFARCSFGLRFDFFSCPDRLGRACLGVCTPEGFLLGCRFRGGALLRGDCELAFGVEPCGCFVRCPRICRDAFDGCRFDVAFRLEPRFGEIARFADGRQTTIGLRFHLELCRLAGSRLFEGASFRLCASAGDTLDCALDLDPRLGLLAQRLLGQFERARCF